METSSIDKTSTGDGTTYWFFDDAYGVVCGSTKEPGSYIVDVDGCPVHDWSEIPGGARAGRGMVEFAERAHAGEGA